MWLCDIVAFCRKSAVLGGAVGWACLCGKKLSSYGNIRILLAK